MKPLKIHPKVPLKIAILLILTISEFEITFIDKLKWSKRVYVAFKSPIEAVIANTTLTSVLTGCRTRLEDLLPTITVVPETVLNRVKLEWNRKRIKLGNRYHNNNNNN